MGTQNNNPTNSKLRNLVQRSISGLIFGIIVILMIDLSHPTYVILWTVFAILSLIEFYVLISKYGSRLGTAKTQKICAIVGTIYILQAYLLLIFGFNGILFEGDDSKHMFVLMLLTLVWANDVGAYCIGITLGKHKMAPKISPKKSWEGFAGGVVFTVIAAILWKILCWDNITGEWNEDYPFYVVLGIVTSLAAVVGDLIESAFKRDLEIKDSGNFLPGHGGVLDRMDSMLLATPVVAIFVYIFYSVF